MEDPSLNLSVLYCIYLPLVGHCFQFTDFSLVPGLNEARSEHLYPEAGQDPGQDPKEPADLCEHWLVSGVHFAPGALSGQILSWCFSKCIFSTYQAVWKYPYVIVNMQTFKSLVTTCQYLAIGENSS